MSRDCAPPTTARISITVTEFCAIGGRAGWSRADIELTDTGHGRVSQGRVNDPIVVSAEVYLDCFLSPRAGDRYTYTPVGISFRETADAALRGKPESRDRKGDGRDPLGRSAFPVRTFVSRGDTMQLTLFDANPEPNEFKFDLVIQRSDGLLGIIDPTIRNNPIMK